MKRLFKFAQKTMPSISKTERIALYSGSVGVERNVFSGKISIKSFDSYKINPLTKNDTKMLDAVPKLIQTVDDYDILCKRFTPIDHPFWNHAKTQKFFGLIVPEEYGGVKMSNTGLSKLLQRLASASASAQVHVMVPASLGPAELLSHYGTDDQKQHFLPKLAKGAIPCFALTSAEAGSDAAGSMVDTGTVIRKDDDIKIILNCDKRYITLAPVADLVGIAFKIEDPDNICLEKYGKQVHGEITLALIEKERANLELGASTDPLGIGFANGTVVAKNVELSIKDIIGEERGLGEGWKFLMEALAAGRGIALPAGASGSSKMLTNAVSGYAAIRKQFKTPISSFEGIREKLSDMALKTLEIHSLVTLMNSILDHGERPPIMSAILKQRTTELGRDVVMHSMDIVAGSAICMGPQNFVAASYLSSPIGITVEGSNTMTRSLLIFGQGLVRSHPHLLNIIDSIESNDQHAFSKHLLSLFYDSFCLLLKPNFYSTDVQKFVRFFAISSNASLLLGGSLKKREYLSGRYADLLSFIIAQYAIEWHSLQSKDKIPTHLIESFTIMNLNRLENTSNELIENHPHSAIHRILYRRFVGSWRQFDSLPDFSKDIIVKDMTTHDSQTRRFFSEDVLTTHPNVVRIEKALSTKNTNEFEILAKQIIKVDTFMKH